MCNERLSDSQLIRGRSNSQIVEATKVGLNWFHQYPAKLSRGKKSISRASHIDSICLHVCLIVCLCLFLQQQHLAQNRDGLRWNRIFSRILRVYHCVCIFVSMFVFIFSISLCLCRQQPIKGNFQPGTKRANRDGAESVFSHSESLSLCLCICFCVCVCICLPAN